MKRSTANLGSTAPNMPQAATRDNENSRKMTRSEADRKKLEFISNLKINSNEYKISIRIFNLE